MPRFPDGVYPVVAGVYDVQTRKLAAVDCMASTPTEP
jgi:hypothetical protein